MYVRTHLCVCTCMYVHVYMYINICMYKCNICVYT